MSLKIIVCWLNFVFATEPVVLIDITDPGMDVDDTLALAVTTCAPQMADTLKLVVSSDETADYKRARLTQWILGQSPCRSVPVVAGLPVDRAKFFLEDKYLSDPIQDTDFVTRMTVVLSEAKKQNARVVIHAHGALGELKALLESDQTIKDQIDTVVIMAGSFDRVEHNIGRDIVAAEYVLRELGAKTRWVTVHTTASNPEARIQSDAPLVEPWMTGAYASLLQDSIQKFEAYLNGRYPYSLAHDVISLAACRDVMFPQVKSVVQFDKVRLALMNGKFVLDENGTETWVSRPAYDFDALSEWVKSVVKV